MALREQGSGDSIDKMSRRENNKGTWQGDRDGIRKFLFVWLNEESEHPCEMMDSLFRKFQKVPEILSEIRSKCHRPMS